MKRWNGWGRKSTVYRLPDSAWEHIRESVGEGRPMNSVSLESIVRRVPESRLPDHPLVSKDPSDRIRHSSGQSLPDWIAFHWGHYPQISDGVAYPENESEVSQLIHFARQNRVAVIPYGGGTSVTGHLTPLLSERGNLTIDMGRMNRMLSLNEENQTATFEAGIRGPDLESALRAKGYTLGHYPQSFEYASLGGWVASRSAGQFSMGYGRIEGLLQACRMVTPAGLVNLPEFPASAAGPDLKEMILGSEGRLGIITRCTVRIQPLAEKEIFKGAFFRDDRSGQDCVRDILQAGIRPAMLRLSYEAETSNMLALNGESSAISLLNRYLGLRGFSNSKAMLLYGAIGEAAGCGKTIRRCERIIRKYRGIPVGRTPGKKWYHKRFQLPYLRNSLWEAGYGIDTLETAVPWDRVSDMVQGIETALTGAITPFQERISVFTHLSHIYRTGSSIYTTYLFRLGRTAEETLEKWRQLKCSASDAIVKNCGTISHQHGIGTDHLSYLPDEKGEQGIQAIGRFLETFDPDGIMNPGKLISGQLPGGEV